MRDKVKPQSDPLKSEQTDRFNVMEAGRRRFLVSLMFRRTPRVLWKKATEIQYRLCESFGTKYLQTKFMFVFGFHFPA